MTVALVLQWTSMISGFVSAALWLLSANVKVPHTFEIHVVEAQTCPIVQPTSGDYIGQGHSPELEELSQALHHQSRISAWAASATAIAVACQAISFFVS